MESMVLDGKKLSNEILGELKEKISKEKLNKRIAIISVGDDYGSEVYCNMKKKKAEQIGLNCDIFHYEKISQNELEQKIIDLSTDEIYAGLMIQHPLPKGLDEQKCFNLIPYKKDIDGLSAESLGLMIQGRQKYVPATALAIMKILEKYNINIVGETVLVIGKSQIVGLPLSVMLMRAGATVTVAHSRTKNLQNMVKNYKIVIVAIGKAEYVKADWLGENQIIIDAGYNFGNVGDVEKTAYLKSSYYTPVPGGVGPMTIAMLLSQSVDAMEKQNK